MPKSRNNRKNRDSKLKSYKIQLKQRQESLKKSYIEMIQNNKLKEIQSKIMENKDSGIIDNLDLGLDNLDLDLNNLDFEKIENQI